MLKPRSNINFAEFVEWERAQPERHELVGGRIVEFRSGSLDHETITVNIIAKLHAAVDPPCRVFPSTAIVQTISRTGEDGYRPDITVSCSPANIGSRLYVEAPLIVVEVTSPSNAGHAWNHKLFEYWNTLSIEQLVLVDSRERHVTSYRRDAEGLWGPPTIMESEGRLEVAVVSIEITLAAMYAGTSLAITSK